MDKTCILVLVIAAFLNVSVNAQAFNCINKNDGNYPDPVDACSGFFYMCSNGNPYYFACALKGTVFSATLDRCEYCDKVSPCNSNPNAIRCPLEGPTCPSVIPEGYGCVCTATSCDLVLLPTTAVPRPTCPPYDPNVYTCTCSASSCQLNLIPTTTPARPTCPAFDPNVYTCVCGSTSCSLQLIPTTSRPGVTAPCAGRTIRPTQSPFYFDCTGKADGNYEDPVDPCSGGFYMCTNQVAKYFDCALQNTVFDKNQNRCDYCSVVTACSASG